MSLQYPAASRSLTSREHSAANPALPPAFSRSPGTCQAAGARGSLHLQELCHVLAIMSSHQIHNFDLRALWSASWVELWGFDYCCSTPAPAVLQSHAAPVPEAGVGSAMHPMGCLVPSPPPACGSSCPVSAWAGPHQDPGPATFSTTVCHLLFSISEGLGVPPPAVLGGSGCSCSHHPPVWWLNWLVCGFQSNGSDNVLLVR